MLYTAARYMCVMCFVLCGCVCVGSLLERGRAGLIMAQALLCAGTSNGGNAPNKAGTVALCIAVCIYDHIFRTRNSYLEGGATELKLAPFCSLKVSLVILCSSVGCCCNALSSCGQLEEVSVLWLPGEGSDSAGKGPRFICFYECVCVCFIGSSSRLHWLRS